MPILDALLKRGGGEFMKDLAEEVLPRLMSYDVDGRIDAGHYKRNDERTHFNGYRERAFDTRLDREARARTTDRQQGIDGRDWHRND